MRLVDRLWKDDIMGIGRGGPQLEKLAEPELLYLLEGMGDTSPIAAEVFVDRVYWDRIWTVQEAVLSRACRLIAGNETCFVHALIDIIDWAFRAPLNEFLARDVRADFPDDVAQTMRSIQGMVRNIQLDVERCLPLAVLMHIRRATFRIGARRRYPDIEQAIDCVGLASGRRATDPRDKLFGLAALVDIGVEIDYNMSTKDLYIAFAKRMVTQLENALELLMWAGLSSQSSTLGLPSWVPDWGISPRTAPVYGGKLEKTDLEGLQPMVLGATLQVRGVCLGIIESTSQPGLAPGARTSMGDSVSPSVMERCHRVMETAEYLMGCDLAEILDEILPQPLTAHRYNDDTPLLIAVLDLLMPSTLRSSECPASHDVASLIHCFFVSEGISLLPPESGDADVVDAAGRWPERHVLSKVCDKDHTEALDRNDILLAAAYDFRGPAFNNSLLGDGYEARADLSMYVYFRTIDNRLGYGARGVQGGDSIYVLGSCANLVILRPVGNHFVLLSPCHVVGFGGASSVNWENFQSGIEDVEIK